MRNILGRKVKFASASARCLFCIHCEEKIDLEASRCFGETQGVRDLSQWTLWWPSRPEIGEGLEVGRKLVALDRSLLVPSGASDEWSDYRRLTARYRIWSREAGLNNGLQVSCSA